MARSKYFFRVKNAGLLDIEQAKIQQMALRGYAVDYISKRFIIFKPCGRQREIYARLVYFEVADPGYNRLVDSFKTLGWEYQGNDGMTLSLFVHSDSDAPMPAVDAAKQQAVIKRHFNVQLFLIAFGIIAFFFTFPIVARDELSLSKTFIFSAWAAYILQWIFIAISQRKTLNIMRGVERERQSALAYRLHMLWSSLIVVVLILAVACFGLSI